MRRGWSLIWLTALAFAASCSGERKLSHVETRIPAAADSRGVPSVSALRSRLAQPQKFARACPAEITELLPVLSLERVKFPPCPATLGAAIASARGALQIEEIAAADELLETQCRPSAGGGLPEALAALVQEPERDRARAPASVEAPVAESRGQLREALRALRVGFEPLEQWVRNNGEFTIPDEQLEFLDRLVGAGGCRMSDQEIDLGYRTLRNLEDLARVQPESEPQRGRVERLLAGVHRIFDRKIQEYFQR